MGLKCGALKKHTGTMLSDDCLNGIRLQCQRLCQLRNVIFQLWILKMLIWINPLLTLSFHVQPCIEQCCLQSHIFYIYYMALHNREKHQPLEYLSG